MIPAKYYYDDATQDQWQQKKKSKKELQEHKRAKLDPESKNNADEYTNSHASAKDVMKNKAKTAKKIELPSIPKLPKPIVEEESEEQGEDEEDNNDNDDDEDEVSRESDSSLIPEGALLVFDDEGNEITNGSSLKEEKFTKQEVQQKLKSKPELTPEEKQKKEQNLRKLREKLNDKINNLKEKRKAPGTKTPGAPKSREQILAERKKREELKRLEKLKRKHDELEDEDESDDSGSEVEDEGEGDNAVLYGNIVFNDGSRVTSDLSKLRNTAEKNKKKGPANNDIKAHLLKLEKKKEMLSKLTPEEQTKEKSKEQWKRVLSQAEGVKIKDDEKLLKKALKRKEKQKLKSEIEWRERKQVVKDTISARAKRREDNLKSRKENKGKKSKNIPKLKKFTGVVKKAANKGKKRAGFEGSAKSNGKSKK